MLCKIGHKNAISQKISVLQPLPIRSFLKIHKLRNKLCIMADICFVRVEAFVSESSAPCRSKGITLDQSP